MRSAVAIIGAGPGGIVAARYLHAHGFTCTLFEQSDDIGGQWNAHGQHSGIWPGMRTNTSRVLTCFSDLAHEPETATYPTNEEILAYLKRYASQFDANDDVRLNTRVELIERTEDGYKIKSATRHGGSRSEEFSSVVVASGRYQRPSMPHVVGAETFTGSGGIVHSFNYKHPETYRGLRVLVGGCAISALEIASDFAMLGAAKVVSTYRRQRYVLPKLFAGVPTDHVAFTRYNAFFAEAFGPEAAAEKLKDLVLRATGSPEQFGAFKPAESITDAGITLSQEFLPLVAEGLITVKPWISKIDRERLTFADGSAEDFDAIVFATGYELSVPFLSGQMNRTLAIDRHHINLYKHTFHPDLPGLAFVGLFDQTGPYFPVLELQARWIAYTWSGEIPSTTADSMSRGIADYQQRRGQPQKSAMHYMAMLFARAAGVEPSPDQFPDLKRALLFGPLSPASFRLTGPDRLANAAELCRTAAADFGAISSEEFRPEETEQLAALRKVSRTTPAGHIPATQSQHD